MHPIPSLLPHEAVEKYMVLSEQLEAGWRIKRISRMGKKQDSEVKYQDMNIVLGSEC
jgi:hypothetical protein